MRRWDGLVDGYVVQLKTRGLAESTVTLRHRELVRFGVWLKARRPRLQLEQVEAEHIVRYVRARSSFHARSTVACAMSNLRCMGEYLVARGIWSANPLRWMRGPKCDPRQRLPRRLGRAEMTAIWTAASERRQAHARYQALCILAILYGTGLRRGELARLSVDDWDGEHGVLRIDGRKTGRPRCVPVGEGVWRCIEAYLPHRHNRLELASRLDEPALLINKHGHGVNGQGLSSVLRRLVESAGLERITLHQFRHSCASDLLEAGVTLPEVQRILGHAGIQSTVRYVTLTDPERVAAIGRHPINQFLAASEGKKERP